MEYMSIGEFARRLGVTAQTLRNWDKEGYLKPSYVTEGKTRYYSEALYKEFTAKHNRHGNYKKEAKHTKILGCYTHEENENNKKYIKNYMTARGYRFTLININESTPETFLALIGELLTGREQEEKNQQLYEGVNSLLKESATEKIHRPSENTTQTNKDEKYDKLVILSKNSISTQGIAIIEEVCNVNQIKIEYIFEEVEIPTTTLPEPNHILDFLQSVVERNSIPEKEKKKISTSPSSNACKNNDKLCNTKGNVT